MDTGGMEPAPARARNWWSRIAGAVLAVVLLYFSLRGIEWRRVWGLILEAHWQYMLVAALLTAGTYFLRSLRWRVLLNASADFPVTTVFWATMAGYLGNNFLPARAGEFIRTLLISGRSSLSKTYVLTTALMERVSDAIVLVLCGSVILLGVDQKPAWMNDVSRSITIAATLGALTIAVLPYIDGLVRRILGRLPLPHALRDRLCELVEQIVLGLRAFHHVGRFLQFSVLTVLIWAGDAAGVVIGVHVVGAHVSFTVALLLLVGLGLSSALPSTPGYVGIYQFVTVTVLGPFGIDRNSALAYIILSQASGYVLVLLLGGPAFYYLRRKTPAIQSAASVSDRTVASGGSAGPLSR